MASTATSRLRLNKQGTYDNPETWGIELNNGMIDMVDDAVGGFTATISGDVILSVENFTEDQARKLFMILDGAGGFTVTVPAVDKMYFVDNQCAADVTVKPAGGTGAVIRAGTKAWWYCDGTDGFVHDPTLDKVKAPAADLGLNGKKLVNVAKGTGVSDAATLANEIQQFAVPTAALPMNGQRISDLGAAVDPDDAVTRGYVDTLASSGNLATVAGIAAEIIAVDDISTEVQVVAANVTPINVVAANIVAVDTVADNIAAIIAATNLTPSLTRVERSSNTALAAADKSKFIDITSGTFTQTFEAAATLGDGWFCYIRNSGTGDITLDPNGAETIDGLASYIMYPGEMRLVMCDGIAFRTVVLNAFSKVFTTSASFIKPPGYSRFGFIIRSGGNSGGRTAAGANAVGGAGGGAFPGEVEQSKLSATESVNVGAGGASVTTNDTVGNFGGSTTFLGITVQANSNLAYGGSIAPISVTPGINSVGFEPPPSQNSVGAYGGGSNNPAVTPTGGSSIHGGGAGGNINSSNAAGAGGSSRTAGGGGAASTSSAGAAGTAPSGGGGASRNGFASGAGARGQVDIWGIA